MNTIPQAIDAGKTASVPIFVNDKPVGRVYNGVFYKHVKASIHFLRQPRAICFDTSTIDDADRAGANVAFIIDDETNDTYTAPFDAIRKHCFPVRRNYGEQIGLTLNYWQRNGQPSEKEQQEQAEQEEQQRINTVQLSLFGGAQ